MLHDIKANEVIKNNINKNFIKIFWVLNCFNLTTESTETLHREYEVLLINKNIFSEQNDYLREKYDLIIYYPIVIIGVPIFEECVYRLYLNPTRFTLATFSGLIFLHFTVNIWYYKSYAQGNTYFFILIAIIVFLLVYCSVTKRLIFYLGGKYFKPLFYFSAILFGFIHLSNYGPLSFQKIILSPLIVSSHIICGFVLGYIRIKNGLVWSILLHAIINSIASAIELLK